MKETSDVTSKMISYLSFDSILVDNICGIDVPSPQVPGYFMRNTSVLSENTSVSMRLSHYLNSIVKLLTLNFSAISMLCFLLSIKADQELTCVV